MTNDKSFFSTFIIFIKSTGTDVTRSDVTVTDEKKTRVEDIGEGAIIGVNGEGKPVVHNLKMSAL